MVSDVDPGAAFVFSYGSNMLTRRIRERTPSAFSIGTGEIRGYRIAFHKRGADGSGKANARHTGDDADRAHGVLYRIEAAELERLDAVEVGYRRRGVHVITAWGHIVEAVCYEALDEHVRPELLPFGWYHQLVLAGAREHGLPAHHVLWIACHASREDPDEARRRKGRRLLER